MRPAHVHTIPVDPSLSVDEAWAEIVEHGRRVTVTGTEGYGWVECDGEVCRSVEYEDLACSGCGHRKALHDASGCGVSTCDCDLPRGDDNG